MRLTLLLHLLAPPVILLAAACTGGDADDSVPLPDLTPFTTDQAERLHAIRDEVADLRGLDVVEGLEEGSISREQWQTYSRSGYESLSEEDRAEMEYYNSVWRLMRLIELDQDVYELTSDVSGAVVSGFYTFEERALVLINEGSGGSEGLSMTAESTMAHEYVHSFQDARFDLEAYLEARDGDEDRVTELDSTLPCVIEGDASLAGLLYMFDEHGFAWIEEESKAAEGVYETLDDVPAVVLEYSSFNYDECFDFVLLVHNRDEWAGVDSLYTNPPTTSEQVLHVQKYFDGENAAEMPESDLSALLGDGWDRFEVGAFGEYDVRTFFASASEEIDASRAAGGWGGGRMAAYRHGDGEDEDTLLHISLQWDTEADYEDFGQAFREALVTQGWQVGQAPDHWYWQDGEDVGYALFDTASRQYDIIYSTDAGAADIARAALRDGLATSR